MKKKLLTLVFSLAALFMLSTAAFAMSDVDYMYNNANLRTGPGTSYSVICVVPSGTQVYLNDFNSDNSWVNIIYTDVYGGNTFGWTWAGNLNNFGASARRSSSSGSTGGSAAPSQGTLYVNATHLNLRSAPDASSSIYTSMPYNAAVTLINDLGNGWDYVAFGNYQGYCSNAYLTVQPNGSNVTYPSAGNSSSGSRLPLIGKTGANSHGSYVVKGTSCNTPMYAGEGTDGVMINVPGGQYVECYSIDGSGYAFCGYNGYYGFIACSALIG